MKEQPKIDRKGRITYKGERFIPTKGQVWFEYNGIKHTDFGKLLDAIDADKPKGGPA